MPLTAHAADSIPATDPGLSLLEVSGVHKRFGGVHALRGAQLALRAGEVHALVGENGAGKSTLINILAGAIRRDSGSIVFAGEDADFRSPAESQHRGIAVIHQELAMLPTLSVAENLFMGRMPSRLGWVDRRAMRARARELLAEVGLDVDPATRVSELGVSHQQLVEIAKALSMGARLLIMDEPTASLTEHETQRLLALVRRLRAAGVAIVYVSHRFAEVFAIADRLTVMRDGATVRTMETARTTPPEVVALMVGRDLAHSSSAPAGAPAGAPGDIVLELRGVSRAGSIANVSFDVRRGEIVGMAGLVGAGRSETARAIFGADPHDEGEILLDGRAVHFASPGDALAAGVAMCAEDRKQLALFMDKAVRWNISIARLPAISPAGFVRRRRERALAQGFVDRLRVRTPDLATPVRQLSGGNQQKTVLARWLATEPKLLILDEPTHGVDVGAKAEIYALIRGLAAQGIAILLISSELPEILDLSDRIVVMREGRVAGVVPRAVANEQTIMMLATGTAPTA
ncbi:MAG TPA: sugar ABC transporter ATP-binding protein [Gemmatimonadaceae bacterium]|nr:sugar ABC transporter ATP-binding protein [Gemmatimonadaceae bacterium]